MHLIIFIIRVYHDARSSEYQYLAERSTQPVVGQPFISSTELSGSIQTAGSNIQTFGLCLA